VIRVVIIDDETLVRQGIRSLLQLADDIEVVADTGDGEEAVRLVRELEPEVVLLDLRMPEFTGLDLLREFHAKDLDTGVIILTTFDDDESMLEAVRLGARGFLLKDVTLDQLLAAVRTVSEGKTLIQPALTERVLRGLAERPEDGADDWMVEELSSRETEILRLIAGGFSNREIADSLCLAEGTVKNHVSNILAKLGVRDRTRAVLRGIDRGFI
jgi:DNA-binding NarL/FixJ family response regulator